MSLKGFKRGLPAVRAKNQSVYIPLSAKHRMESSGKLPMVQIEVQIGIYLSEDDIPRYEDVYVRI
jgi:mannose-1-phosphate guanylyltransferase/mannose-6-phosphate isomerase